MKKIFILFELWLIVLIPIAKAAAVDTAQQILQVSGEPLIPFVKATVQMPSLSFPPPGDKLADPKLSQAYDLLFSRISSSDQIVKSIRGVELFNMLESMCSLRAWLLQRPVYSNLVLTFKINVTVSRALIVGLSDGSITTDDAKRITGSLSKNPSIDSLLLAAEGGVPKSKAITDYRQKVGTGSLMELSGKIGEEGNEGDLLFTDPTKYLREITPSEFIIHAAGSENLTYAAGILAAYISQGGNVNLQGNEFKSDLEQKIPRFKDSLSPDTGDKIDSHKLEFFIKEARRWETTQSAK